jgi:hypothetical protein
MLALCLLLVIVAIVLGIVGVVVKGPQYLLIIGIVVFLGALSCVPRECGVGPGSPRRGNPSPNSDTALIGGSSRGNLGYIRPEKRKVAMQLACN